MGDLPLFLPDADDAEDTYEADDDGSTVVSSDDSVDAELGDANREGPVKGAFKLGKGKLKFDGRVEFTDPIVIIKSELFAPCLPA